MNQLDADLTGKFLIAMPDMEDERFRHSVIYICAHGEDGAMGLIVNRLAEDLELISVLEHMGIDAAPGMGRERMQVGGPVEPGRGFVLHSPELSAYEGTMKVSDKVSMTASRDILQDVAEGRGPRKALFALGYSGWGSGQLETEIAQNGWLVTEGSNDLIFSQEQGGKWMAALRGMGVEPGMLSGTGGRA